MNISIALILFNVLTISQRTTVCGQSTKLMSSSRNIVLHRKRLSSHTQACGFYAAIYNVLNVLCGATAGTIAPLHKGVCSMNEFYKNGKLPHTKHRKLLRLRVELSFPCL